MPWFALCERLTVIEYLENMVEKKPSGNPARFCVIDFAPITASDFFIHILSVIMLLHAQVSSDNAATVSYCYWLHAQRKAERERHMGARRW